MVTLSDDMGRRIETNHDPREGSKVVGWIGEVAFWALYGMAVAATGNILARAAVKDVWNERKIEYQRQEQKVKNLEKKSQPIPTQENQEQSSIEQVPVFEGYEFPVLQKYDKTLVQARDFWNAYLKNEENYKQPSLKDLKKIVMVETAWGGKPVKEFYSDPMQVYKDFGYKIVFNEGGEGFFPKGGVKELKNLKLNQAEKSIYAGVPWFVHKSTNYDNRRHIKSMDYSKGHKRYNGGGDKNYVKKINSLKVKNPRRR